MSIDKKTVVPDVLTLALTCKLNLRKKKTMETWFSDTHWQNVFFLFLN